MTDEQLTRLRLLESELLHLHRQATATAVRAFELHELACDLLREELQPSGRSATTPPSSPVTGS